MKGTKELKTNKGITLIALVITIIVMLVLVSVSITMAVNGGLFDYAKKASSETKNAMKDEQWLADGGIQIGDVYYSIDDYVSQATESNGSRIKLSYKVDMAEDEQSAVITVNAKMLGNLAKGIKEINENEDYETWAARNLEGKTPKEIEQIFVDGLNYMIGIEEPEAPKFKDIDEFVAANLAADPERYSNCEDIYDIIAVEGFESLADAAITMNIAYLEEYMEQIIHITDPSGTVWEGTNTVEYTVCYNGEFTFTATNESGTESNSITVKIDKWDEITFAFNGGTYIAFSGETWGEWIEREGYKYYLTVTASGGIEYKNGYSWGPVCHSSPNGEFIRSQDVIQPGGNYLFRPIPM